MSGYNNYSDDLEDYEGESQTRGGGGLRKMLEETLAENKRLIGLLEGKERASDMTALFKEKGIDPAIAEIIPKDVDAKEWVEKYAHLLGVPKNTESEESAAAPEAQLADDNDPALVARREELAEEQKALAEMQEAAESGYPAAVTNDLLEKMEKIDSEDVLLEFFKSNGKVGG